jgi:hypothetical protein
MNLRKVDNDYKISEHTKPFNNEQRGQLVGDNVLFSSNHDPDRKELGRRYLLNLLGGCYFLTEVEAR